MSSDSAPGSVAWMIGNVYGALALLTQPTPEPMEAATLLDEVLAQGFQDKPDHDHWVIAAAKWRILAAERLGETGKTQQLVQWIRGADCTKNIKSAFLAIYDSAGGPRR